MGEIMLKIAICDDEPLFCRLLEEKLEARLNASGLPFRVFRYSSGEQLPMTGYNILFLDIRMPGINGMELARRLRENGNSCAIIFITVIKEQVFDAFEVEAVDYLCKPLDDIRLSHALDRAIRYVGERDSRMLLVRTGSRLRSIRMDDILYCEVINRKVLLHLRTGGEVVEYYSRLSDVEKQLDSRFLKCHRSYLVNLDHLSECSKNTLTLTGGVQIPLSESHRRSYMEQMLHHMKSEVEAWPRS